MNRRIALTVVLVGLLVTAGCLGKARQHGVDFGGEVEYANETFTMDGEVFVTAGTAEPQTYPNVTVELYAANGTRLDVIRLGTMSAQKEAPSERSTNITRPYRPKYVVIESPGFWHNDRFSGVVAFEWEENLSFYDPYGVSDPDEKLSGD